MARNKTPRFEEPLEALLDEDETAVVLNTTPRTLQDQRYRGVGPEYVKVGKLVRYAPSALREYIRQRTRRSTSDPGAEPRPAADS